MLLTLKKQSFEKFIVLGYLMLGLGAFVCLQLYAEHFYVQEKDPLYYNFDLYRNSDAVFIHAI